jgi:hypothetical protein
MYVYVECVHVHVHVHVYMDVCMDVRMFVSVNDVWKCFDSVCMHDLCVCVCVCVCVHSNFSPSAGVQQLRVSGVQGIHGWISGGLLEEGVSASVPCRLRHVDGASEHGGILRAQRTGDPRLRDGPREASGADRTQQGWCGQFGCAVTLSRDCSSCSRPRHSAVSLRRESDCHRFLSECAQVLRRRAPLSHG